jgi:hypothetical protein
MKNHNMISGALFDFLGYLTTRPVPRVIGAHATTSPEFVELLSEWAATRNLDLSGADVALWHMDLDTNSHATQTSSWHQRIAVAAAELLNHKIYHAAIPVSAWRKLATEIHGEGFQNLINVKDGESELEKAIRQRDDARCVSEYLFALLEEIENINEVVGADDLVFRIMANEFSFARLDVVAADENGIPVFYPPVV